MPQIHEKDHLRSLSSANTRVPGEFFGAFLSRTQNQPTKQQPFWGAAGRLLIFFKIIVPVRAKLSLGGFGNKEALF